MKGSVELAGEVATLRDADLKENRSLVMNTQLIIIAGPSIMMVSVSYNSQYVHTVNFNKVVEQLFSRKSRNVKRILFLSDPNLIRSASRQLSLFARDKMSEKGFGLLPRLSEYDQISTVKEIGQPSH